MSLSPYVTVSIALIEEGEPETTLNAWAADGYAIHSTLPTAEGYVKYLLEHRSVRASTNHRQEPRQAPRAE